MDTPTVLHRIAGVSATALTMLGVGAFAVWEHQPFLVPSLAAAAFLQTLPPRSPSARPWPTAMGQLAGLAGGLIAVHVTAATATPTFMDHHVLSFARVLATCVAVLLTGAAQIALNAISPAGGATALIVTLGAETADWIGALRVVVGILLVTCLGEATRHLLLRVR